MQDTLPVDAPRRSRDTAPAGNDQRKPIQDKPWLSTALCRCVSWSNLQQQDQAGAAAAGSQWQLAGCPCSRKAVVALCAGLTCLLALLASSTALGVAVGRQRRRQLQLRQEAGLSSVAQYMHAIAAWHDASRQQQQEAALPVVKDAAGFSWQACSQHMRLPEIQLPIQLPGPQWQPNAEGCPADPLAQLALDCSSPGDAAACEAAAASNSYEGEQLPLDDDDLQAHVWAADEPQQLSSPDSLGPHDLSELDLNCEADPEACEAIAAASNSYESSGDQSGSSFDAAAAEAAAFLAAAAKQRDASWDALLAQEQQLLLLTAEQREAALLASNSYEGEEQQWVATRVAEEAGPHWLDVSRLDLDCSQDSDPATVAECERSRAVNRYEGPDTAGGSQASALIGPASVDDAAQPHSHAAWRARHRSSGYYSVPAVEPAAVVRRLTAAAVETGAAAGEHFGPAPGSTMPALQADELLRARRYFKGPCNSRLQHIAYKGEAGQHRQRLFYKNAANAPATMAAGATTQPSQAAGPASAASSRQLGLAVLTAAGMLAAFLAAAAATLHLLCRGAAARRRASAGKPQAIAMRRPCPSTVLVPGTTEELPAPQHARYALQPVLLAGCEIQPDPEQLGVARGCNTLVTSQGAAAAAADTAWGCAASSGDGSAGLFAPAGSAAAAAAGVLYRGVLVHMAELLASSDAPPSQLVDSPRRSWAGTPVPRVSTPVRAGTPVKDR